MVKETCIGCNEIRDVISSSPEPMKNYICPSCAEINWTLYDSMIIVHLSKNPKRPKFNEHHLDCTCFNCAWIIKFLYHTKNTNNVALVYH